jgi:tetratricopeptide (TPR) repeat protein
MPYPTVNAQQLRSWIEVGLAAHHEGDLERAQAAYRQVLAVSPQHPPALNLLGTALLQVGKAAEALVFLENAARLQRGDANLLGNLAQAYFALDRHAEAGQAFRKASRVAPGEARFQVGVAAALAMQGKLSEAELLLRRLAVRFAEAPLVWLNLGNVLRDLARPEPAIEAYRSALALDPHMAEARNSLGSVLHSLQRFDEAETEYRACIEAAPDYLLARYNLASVTMETR